MADHVYKFKEVPKGQRLKFFWDYYRIPVAVGIVGAIPLISILQTVVFAPKKDMSILVAGETYVAWDTWEQAQEKLCTMPLDLNEDGKVIVEINDNYIAPNMQNTDPEAYMAVQTKLMASLSVAESALQVVDEKIMEYFAEEQLLGTYAELPDTMGHEPTEVIQIPLKELKPFKHIEGIPDGLYMTLRPKEAMQLGNSEAKLAAYEKQIQALLLMLES